MKVKYLIEEEIKILRQGVIELEVNDLSNDDDITARRRAIDIFIAALESEDNFSDEVRQSEKYDEDITARRIDIKDNSTYLKRLPIREC